MANPPTVACPQCAAAVVWTPASAWRPFCSERCRLIDLGAWANETYRVQAAPPDEDDSQPEMPRDASGLRDDG